MFLHMGMTITIVSTDNTKPAPREIHTEYCRPLSGARRISPCCFHLLKLAVIEIENNSNLPTNTEQRPVEAPEK